MTDKDDPLGRRAWFEAAPDGGAGPGTAGIEGRRALFSSGQTSRGRRVVVECGSCRAQTPLGLVGLTRRLFPSVWVPARRLSRLMCCPSCRRLTWCRLDWSGLING